MLALLIASNVAALPKVVSWEANELALLAILYTLMVAPLSTTYNSVPVVFMATADADVPPPGGPMLPVIVFEAVLIIAVLLSLVPTYKVVDKRFICNV